MKNLIIIAVIAYAAYYFFYNKKSQCENLEDVTHKGRELAQAVVHAASAKNSTLDSEGLMSELKKIEIMKKNGFPDFQLACDAMDEMIDILD